MTPREALYHLCLELGPIPRTTRNDNLTPKEIRLRDSVDTLKELVAEHTESLDSAQRDAALGGELGYKQLQNALNDLWKKQQSKQ